MPSEHQTNCPIEVEEKEATHEASQSKSKGKPVAINYSQRGECWQHFIEFKENYKKVAGMYKYCGVIYKANPNNNAMKNLENYFP